MRVDALEFSQISANYATVIAAGASCATLILTVLQALGWAGSGPDKKRALVFGYTPRFVLNAAWESC